MTHRVGPVRIVGVIDLRDGQAVHASGGVRHAYAPVTISGRQMRPGDAATLAAFYGELGLQDVYAADLDAIAGKPWQQAFPPLGALGAIAVLAVICSAYAYILYFRLIDSAGATNALLVTLLVPPVAIVVGAITLGESIDPRDFAGLGLIALSLAAIDGRLLSVFQRREVQRAAS